MLEGAHGVLPSYGGKVVQEVVERLAALQIVQEGLKWNSRPPKHGRSPKHAGVARNDVVCRRGHLVSPNHPHPKAIRGLKTSLER